MIIYFKNHKQNIKKILFKLISIVVVFFVLILNTRITFAELSELEKKATDLDQDGKITSKDIDLIVHQPYPPKVEDGVEAAEGANVNYLFRNNTQTAKSTEEILDLTMQYIHAFEGSTPVSEDGTKYQINGDLGVGHGVDIDNGGYTYRFISAGYSVAAGEWVDKDFVDAIEKETIEENYKAMMDATSGLNLKDYQIMALVSRAYNCGMGGAVQVLRGGKSFIEAYNSYWNDSKTTQYFGKSSDESIFNEMLYTTYMSEPVYGEDLNGSGAIVYYEGLAIRRRSEWLLFATGYCDKLEVQCSSENSSGLSHASNDITENAIRIHKHMEDNNYAYACAHNTQEGYSNSCHCDGNSTFYKTLDSSNVKEWYDIRCMDCSAYVSWVLFETGIDIGRVSSYYFYNGEYSGNSKYKWTKMTDWNQLQAGDILVSSVHVGIYIGNEKSLGAGCTEYIRRDYECNSLAGIRNMYEFFVRVNK